MHLFFTSGGGRLANQILNLAHLYAWFLENKSPADRLTVIPFWPFVAHFENLKENKLATFPFPAEASLTVRALYKVNQKMPGTFGRKALKTALLLSKRLPITKIHFESTEVLTLDSPLWNQIASKKRVLLSGWPWRNWELFEKYENQIKQLFEPIDKYKNEAELFLQPLKKAYDVVISVMIRQSDYRTFAGGKYFFESQQYVTWLKQIMLENPTLNIGFVIASEEKQDENLFETIYHNVHFAPATQTYNAKGDAHYMVNQVIHSLCDYIISPPSTFTAWASFIGDVPLLVLKDINQSVSLSDCLKNGLYEGRKHPSFKESVQ